jgi:hypothetical protein
MRQARGFIPPTGSKAQRAARRWPWCLMSFLLVFAPAVWAQPLTPRVGYVYPAGGRLGTSFQIRVGGQFLDGVTNAFFSGPGIQAKVVEHIKPLTQAQFNLLRDQLKELQEKKAAAGKPGTPRTNHVGSATSTNLTWTVEDEKRVAEIRKKLANPPNRQANPAIAETALLQVTLAADAKPGERELRLGTPSGLSNPLVFRIGQLAEFSEPAATNSGPVNARNPNAPGPSAGPEIRITLPATLNGQITPGDVDRYRFQGRKGQDWIAAVSARELIPFIPDAVPGWFQATLALYDAAGKEVAFNDDYRFHPDPVIHCQLPRDGEYVLEIRDAIYRGREDFVYRIAVGELPFVTGIFPLGGPAGQSISIDVTGWNLPTNRLSPELPESAPGIYPISVRQGELFSNPIPFSADTLPECLEKEPNNTAETAQLIPLPRMVNGRINQPGDADVFRFDGQAGAQVVAEVYARRLDSPLDSALRLTDARGRQLAVSDDAEDKGSGLTTHHADSRLRVTLPENGAYYVQLTDTQRKGGPEYGYRLRLSLPRPDFALRVVPSSVNLRSGASIPITVYALRKDGFSNEIALTLKEAPPSFAISGARIPPNQDQVRLTLSAPSTPLSEPVNLQLQGHASIAGQDLTRTTVPAEDMMQAFAYRHLVPARELKVAVSGRPMGRTGVKILSSSPVKIPAGGSARVRLATGPGVFTNQFELELSEPPDGITLQEITPVREGIEITLACDATKAKPGQEGNLIVNIFAARKPPASSAPARPQANRRRNAVGVLPAIPYQIIEP